MGCVEARKPERPWKTSRTSRLSSAAYMAVVALCVILLTLQGVSAGWVDVDTPEEVKKTTAKEDGYPYHLVFSDEFNVNGRNFNDGNDPRWTSINKDDYTNFALQYYSEDLANTNNGYLNITYVPLIDFSRKPRMLTLPSLPFSPHLYNTQLYRGGYRIHSK